MLNTIKSGQTTLNYYANSVYTHNTTTGGINFTTSIDTGNNDYKSLSAYAVGWNGTATIQGSNDNNTWVDLVSQSSSGSGSATDWSYPAQCVTTTMYRYYRAKMQGYNNGGFGLVSMNVLGVY